VVLIGLAIVGALGFALVTCFESSDGASVVATTPTIDPRPLDAGTGPAFTPAESKIIQIELVLAEIDPTLHAIRITWPGDSPWRWSWPSWLTLDQLLAKLGSLGSLADHQPAIPQLDDAARAYSRQLAIDAGALAAMVHTWNLVETDGKTPLPGRPTIVELTPVFERLGRASHALRAALRAARQPTSPPPGSALALHRACMDAVEAIAYLRGATRLAEAVGGTSVFSSNVPREEIAAKARTCMRVAIDYLERPAHDTYVASLAMSIGMGLLTEIERADRAKGGSYVSSTNNIAQPMAFFARKSALK